MSKASDSDSVPLLIRRGDFHFRRLGRRATAKALQTEFEGPHETLKKAHGDLLDAAFERTVHTGDVEGAMATFRGAVGLVGAEVYAAAKRKRKSDLYRAFFPTGRTKETTKAPPEDVGAASQRIADAAAKHPGACTAESVAAVADGATEVADLLVQGAAKDAAVEAAEETVAQVRVPWTAMYNSHDPKLQLLFPDNPALVASFFLRAKSSKKAKAPQG